MAVSAREVLNRKTPSWVTYGSINWLYKMCYLPREKYYLKLQLLQVKKEARTVSLRSTQTSWNTLICLCWALWAQERLCSPLFQSAAFLDEKVKIESGCRLQLPTSFKSSGFYSLLWNWLQDFDYFPLKPVDNSHKYWLGLNPLVSSYHCFSNTPLSQFLPYSQKTYLSI